MTKPTYRLTIVACDANLKPVGFGKILYVGSSERAMRGVEAAASDAAITAGATVHFSNSTCSHSPAVDSGRHVLLTSGKL
jgi:hypothetical protein